MKEKDDDIKFAATHAGGDINNKASKGETSALKAAFMPQAPIHD